MSLSKHKFLPFYNSHENDILEDFYLPALSECTEYKRVSAYFDSGILQLYSSGIECIVNSHGHIYFIFSCELSEIDFNLMKEGYSNRSDIEQNLLKKISVEDKSIDLSNLAFLIQKGFVDIKIAFTTKGIFHDKYGLISSDDEIIYFRGSNNETVAALKNNYESFETSCSWDCDKNEGNKITNAVDDFDKIWSNHCQDTIVMDIPDIVKDKIITFSKGKLILAYQSKENAFIFDLDKENHMIGINNLKYHELLEPEHNFYKTILISYVDRINEKTYIFNHNLGYLKMKKIILLVEEYSQSLKQTYFNIYISPQLRKYLLDCDIELEKRKSLGIAIKHKGNIILDDFLRFQEEIHSLMIRDLRLPQAWDAYHIVKMKRSANFSVPGSGKTSIVYGAFAYLLKHKKVNKIVMVGPLNSFMAWRNEFYLNFGNKLELKLYDYQADKRNYKNSAERYDGIRRDTKECNLILINYESLVNNVEAFDSIIDTNTLLVYDEVHRVKSTSGTRAAAALKVCNNAMYRVVLTGTPIPNGYIDIYNFMHILFPDEYDNYFCFDKSFLQSADYMIDRGEAINESIYPFFCRTTKQDLKVPEAKPDDITNGYCLADENDERMFEIIFTHCSHNIFLLYIRLMQASTNPKLILNKITKEDLHSLDTEEEDNDFSELTANEDFNKEAYSVEEQGFISNFGMTKKFYRCVEMVEEVSRTNQALVWGIFVSTLYETKNELLKRGVTCEVICGSVSIQERERLINDFISGKFRVLIANPHTIAESVSLHKNCHHAFYLEYSFNLVHMLQSRDRIHRLGLPDGTKTYYHYMFLDNPDFVYNSIDVKIYDRLKLKEERQKQAVESTELVYVEDNLVDDINSILRHN